MPAQAGSPPGPPAPSPPPQRDTKALLVRGAGLLVIAVVAGLVWYLIRHDSTPAPVAQEPVKTSPFDYRLVEGPNKSADCAAKSYDDTKKFFQANPCGSLARGLYTVEYGDAKALVSVVKVSMPTAAQATALKALTDRDGTGNVSDLVRDGTYKAAGAPKVSGDQAEYESAVTGTDVTIVLADFYARHRDDVLLKRIATGALELGPNLH
ncbi:hypothetical protein VSH64_20570 [Amycolatopsis rhabdoformis]|uniref:LytR family transcriptional regulator n=1 Tax=Amycolatopsis rhabdoformis TaxID=1448059 RepID=A0ABZ1IKY1_9PSEU|nr:hypothetical protein [Amycolatopsis rhabdoformis]WSE35189.1 hypothetical protein VSH64_20570 [Amycolatopsis rhabdoformis]